jgi:FkbM family methyltransferase
LVFSALQSFPAALVRRLFPWGSTRTVLLGPARGMRFEVVPGMGLRYVVPLGDPFHFAGFLKRVRPAMTIYDIGANRGQMSLLFSRLVGPAGSVIAFKPYAPAYAGLLANLERNGIGNVVARPEAVAERPGEVTLCFRPDEPTQAKLKHVEPLYRQRDPQSVTVRSVALNALVEAKQVPAPQLLKIDVEGAAVVLAGARELIARHGPAIYLELHGPEEQAAVNEHQLAGGYVVTGLDGVPVRDAAERRVSPLWCERR